MALNIRRDIYLNDLKMAKNIILFVFVAIILLPTFSFHASEIDEVFDPYEPGLYHIGYYKVTYNDPVYGRYTATIRYPAKYDGFFAPKNNSDAPYPGIVVANGFAGSEWQIKWIPTHLVTYGYVTMCFTPPQKTLGDTTQWAYGFVKGIEKLKSHNSLWFSPISGILDTETFGAIGLSMGGGGCIEATGLADSEIDAAVALAPVISDSSKNAAQNITVPIQIQVGNNDGIVPPESVLPYYSDLISETLNKEYFSITGGNHIGFIDDFVARFAEYLGLDDPKEIEFEEQRRISSKYFTAWFEYYLRGLDEYFTYIFGKDAQSDLDAGLLSDLRYMYSD
jgi:predicted dienelactone hydrolase